MHWPNCNVILPGTATLAIEGLQLVGNSEAHHTSEYEQSEVILRRGQPFTVAITFNREYKQQGDKITLLFAVGKLCN